VAEVDQYLVHWYDDGISRVSRGRSLKFISGSGVTGYSSIYSVLLFMLLDSTK